MFDTDLNWNRNGSWPPRWASAGKNVWRRPGSQTKERVRPLQEVTNLEIFAGMDSAWSLQEKAARSASATLGCIRKSARHDCRMPTTSKKRGRQPDATSKSGQIRTLLTAGMSVADIASKIGCSANLVYNVKARAEKPAKRGPGRPPKAKAAPAMAELDGIAGIVAAVQASEQEKAKLQSALERIRAVIADALA